MKKIFSAVAALLFSAALTVSAQEAPALAPLQLDPNVRTGVLPNGLTYFVMHNEEPKGRCDFHIAQKVGASLEEDNQNGLAHFLEHMAFNGTEHFPGKLIINYFESVGVAFGRDINAYTSLDETVYRLSNVPTVREGILDSALLVLHDWSNSISLLPEEIDNERGVIREEWRQGATADRRMWRESNAEKYPGTKYAIRDVIGDTAVINNFTYDALRAYYHQWYGPDLQGIVVVGDIDVDKMEQKIKELFSSIPARENRGERPVFPLGGNEKPIVSRVTDPEAQFTRTAIEIKHERLPKEVLLSQQGYLLYTVNYLFQMMESNRLRDMTSKADASFVSGYAGYSTLMGVTDGLVFIYASKPGMEEQCYRDMLTEVERVRRYGFTVSEFERAKADYMASMEKSYNNRAARGNQSLAKEIIRYFIDDLPMPGIEWEHQFVQAALPQLNVEMINQLAKGYITDQNVILSIQGPDKEGVNIPSEERMLAIYDEVKASEIEAPKEVTIDRPLVENEPAKPGTIKKETENKELGATEWTLSNGVRVVIKHTDFKEDEILMRAFSRGGLSKVEDKDLISGSFAENIVESNGIGTFSDTELQIVLAGKNVSVSPSIGDYDEGMSGSSSVKDFETMLMLNYLYFTAPREDNEAFDAMLGSFRTMLANKDANPQAAFGDSVNMTLSGHHPRTILVDTTILPKISQQRAIEIYRERFANPADFTFVFVGNIDPSDPATKAAILKWIGGMDTNKSKKAMEKITDRGIRFPKGHVNNTFKRAMQTNTASNCIVYTADMPYNLKNSLTMKIIGDILSNRYLESVREKEGGSYGVGVLGAMQTDPVDKALILMQYDTDPDKQERILDIIHKEIETIVANGPLADDLSKAKEKLAKSFNQNKEKNSYWTGAIENYYTLGVNAPAEYLDTLNSIDAATVQKMLKTIVDQKNVVEVTMLPDLQ